MALTAPSAVLTGSTIASSFDQLLFVDAAAGMTEATLKIVSTEVGKSALSISDEHVLIKGVDTNNAAGFAVQQTDGTAILTVAADTPAVTLVGDLTVTGNSTFTTADNTDTLTLKSTDADANSGPNLRLYRNSGSPAGNDLLGNIQWEGRNNNSQDVIYSEMRAQIETTTDGSEDANFKWSMMKAGASVDRLSINANATVFNDESVDVDFRVESNGDANMLFVDGGTDSIGIGTNAPNSLWPVHIYNSDAGTDPSWETTEARNLLLMETGNTEARVTIFGTASATSHGYTFADPGNKSIAGMYYSHNADQMTLGSGGIASIIIDSAGAVTKPAQPSFQARPASQQSNIATGSAVGVVFGTEIFDQGADFASNTFTAPVAGRYMLSVNLYLSSVDSAADYYSLALTTSNRHYESIIDPDYGQDSVYLTITHSALADMDASDTAIVTLTQNTGTAQTDIGTASYFSGYLAC
jgi:hypothetical protein